MKHFDFFDTVHESILQGVHLGNYKNGAFKDKITKDTPLLDAIDILIDSSITVYSEKQVFRICRGSIMRMRRKMAGYFQISYKVREVGSNTC